MHKITLALLLLSTLAHSQTSDKRVQPGVFLAFETQNLDLGLPYDPNFPEQTTAWSDRPKAGFGLGAFVAWQVAQSLALRPELIFSYNRNVVFKREDEATISNLNYRFFDAELPVHLILTNKKGKFPLRGSLLFGGRFSWNFSAPPISGGLSLFQQRAGLDVGGGVEISLKKLKIQPEVVWSYGLNNLNDVTVTPPELKIGKVVRDKLSVRVLCFF